MSEQIIEKIETMEKKRARQKKEKEYPKTSVVLRIFRANRISGQPPHYDSIEVPVQRWTTVLDALLQAKQYKDPSICIRYSCRMATCGSCGMKINGIPRLACYTKVSELEGSTITVEPLANFPHIRDLVADFSQFFSHHKRVKPFIENSEADIADPGTLTEFLQRPEELDKFLQFSYCIKCGLCYSACPTVATDTKFPGPQALSQAYRYFVDNRDTGSKERLGNVDERHGIWRCHFAGSCSVVCPKGVDPALGIQLLRGHLLGFSNNEKKIAEKKERLKRD
ncbi:MAG TPA: succinate dehydrogenase iron-sulfur subunit [Nitrososphaera sp.]|jgi:succinate dehydrogenase / fumarate reductase iron-sulfur subunit|nr:succinate dehydrogenase iron-sulfur subunit [Nitrososphaera sp.]